MSKIDKLSILGVRSFDNTRGEVIQFGSPLTLIVGYNGSGKTTIIECLKYATTGDQPPNTKGGAFIHDPKLCGENEVLAQVKLSFKSTSGAKMVATRSLQLTVKKTARSMKTLEGNLLMIKDGERTSISSRVAELDQIMPQYLGVSKAVLDNVIFCHQDESLWPMSEPSTLKNKFDEIFEALKYTKAIDNIKVLRKKQIEALGKLKLVEQHAKDDKDKGDRAERKSRELSADIEDLRTKTRDLGEKIKVATQKSEEAWGHASQFEVIVASLSAKRIEASAKLESVADLKKHVKEMSDSDEQLASILERYDERVAVHQKDMEDQRRQYTDLGQQLEECRARLGTKLSENGRNQADKEAYDRQLEGREILIKATARRHSIRGFEHDLTEEQICDFMERVAKMARDQNAAFEKARRETQQELKTAQHALNKLNERKSALNQSRENAKAQGATNDRKIDSHQDTLDQISIDEGRKTALEANIEDLESKLHKSQSEIESSGWERQIPDTNKRLQAIEEQAELLNFELVQVTKQAGDSARVDFFNKSLRDSQRSLDAMIGAHSDHLTKVLGQKYETSGLEQIYHTVLERKASDAKDAEQKRDDTTRELEQFDFRLNSTRSELKAKWEELRQSETAVREAIDEEASDYPEVLKDVEVNRDTLKRDFENFNNLTNWYGDCIKTLEENNVCRLCERDFKAEKERARFLAKLHKYVSNQTLSDVEKELQEAESNLKGIRAVGSHFETWRRLSQSEVPQLEAEIERLEPRRNALLSRIDEQDRVVNERQVEKREVDSVAKTIHIIIKYETQIHGFEAQIKELSTKDPRSGPVRSLEAVQEQIKELSDESRLLKGTLNRLTSERDRIRTHQTNLDLDLRDARAKLSDAVYQLKEKASVVSQLDGLRQLNKEHRDSMKMVDEEIQGLAPQISQAQARCDDISHRGDGRERELQQETSRMSDSLSQLKAAEKEITSYIDRGGPQQLARTGREIQNLQQDVSRIEHERGQITVEVKKVEDQLRNHSETQRGIQDNLRYRKNTGALKALQTEIAELEAHNAEADRERYTREAEKWQVERSRLSGEQASMMGQMKSKDDQLMQLLNDWNTDYKDAAYKYKEAHIKVEATKAAVEDLGRYGGALDKAIMKYHSVKMEEINRTIEELWRRTYQGTDVDTILIRSDNEGGKGNKSYNYRVCMVKQDAEMDMRGRCSAGQRVLASIIIRLALAECFGVNCGLIALDEPTTNLDRDNIRALAESLHDIIRARQQQSNFQLIVITHDEDFLRYMQCADFCDNYWRVSRNEKQKSIIEKQSIAEVI